MSEKVIIDPNSQLAEDIKQQAALIFKNGTNVLAQIKQSKDKSPSGPTCEHGHQFSIERASDLYNSSTGIMFRARCSGGETIFEW